MEEEELPPDAPTNEEISEYAEYLGLEPGKDAELLWIAEQALVVPTPEGWKEVEDHQGNVLYLNSPKGKAQYAHPCDEEYRGLFRALRAVLSDPVSREEVVDMARYLGIDVKKEQALLWIARQAVVAPLPSGWAEKEDDDGATFYECAEKGIISRRHPLDDTFKLLVSTERQKLGRDSLVRVGNTGTDESATMRLIKSDGSALYTYDWKTGEVTDVHPLTPAGGEKKPEGTQERRDLLASSMVRDLRQKGILQDGGRDGGAGATVLDEDSERALPLVPQGSGRLPLSSRKSGFPNVHRKPKARLPIVKGMADARTKRPGAGVAPAGVGMRQDASGSLLAFLAQLNPLVWLLLVVQRMRSLLQRGGGKRAGSGQSGNQVGA